jgi:hypothetical protein
MLVSPRTMLATRSVGALVTLDLLYELVEGNLSSERQKDLSDIAQRWKDDAQDGDWAARVAKVICLLEFVRDLPRSETNIAALLVDTVDKAAPVAEVKTALARLEAAQFIRLTPEGYKLQTAQEKRWISERNALDPKQKDRDTVKSEILEDIFIKDPRFKTYRYRDLRTFPVGITVDGRRLSDGQVPLVLCVVDDESEFEQRLEEARSDSRSKGHLDEIFWVFILSAEIHGLTKQLHASRQMIGKYSQLGAQGSMIGEHAASLESEKRDETRFRDRLREKMLEALGSGRGIFRGVTRDASDLGKTPLEIFKQLFDYAVPDLYPKLEMGARTLKGTEAEEVLKAANLNALSQVFYSGDQGLHLVVKEGSRFVPNPEAPVASEVLGYLTSEHAYGNKVTGKDLEQHFTQRPGCGWDLDMVRLILAVLLRAGAIEMTSQGHRYRDHADPQSRAPFTNLPTFRATSFAPHQRVGFKEQTLAVSQFEKLTGHEVDVDPGTIAQALKKLADEEREQLLPVMAVVRMEHLPGLEALESYQKTLEGIRGADTDGCVQILAGEGNSLKTERDQARRIREAVTDGQLALIRQARLAAEEQWPLLAIDGVPSSLAEQAEELAALLSSSALYEQLPRVRVLTKAIVEAYRLAYLAEHQARLSEYTQAADEIKGHHEWASIQASGRASILLPLTQRSCEQAELPDGAMVCQRCKTSLSLIKEHRHSLQALKQEALKRFFETLEAMNPGPPIEHVKLTRLFPEMLESEQDVEEALGRVRDHLLKLVAQGARIRVE